MIVAGIMSGTSADGVDVALARLTGRGLRTRFELIAHRGFPYPSAVRRAVLAAMNADAISVRELARLNFRLAQIYSECVAKTARAARVQCELIGCHGQTLYHQGQPAPYLGRPVACTWQTGSGSVLAQLSGVPVVSDFRPSDMAASGRGAPLVPFLDLLVFRHPRRGRIVLNLGGIANLTAIPAAATPEDVRAFDTGPGNMVIDALCEQLFHKPFDRAGRFAARGTVLDAPLWAALRQPFFRQRAPRTAGREEFGREFAAAFLQACGNAATQDVLATATRLTARSIAEAIQRLARQANYHDLFVSGGGTRNATLMMMLTAEVAPLGLTVQPTDAAGIPSQAKEALAFAVLAYQTWQRQPSNVPGATGAKRAVILGQVSYV
ncbi:MAG: anhydro-N-acetylmuramic acid kinase [Acidobacteriota bacterium]|nr:anhydro-N-acetylmuramic acid kinase [Acidobacteriota bacterium]